MLNSLNLSMTGLEAFYLQPVAIQKQGLTVACDATTHSPAASQACPQSGGWDAALGNQWAGALCVAAAPPKQA